MMTVRQIKKMIKEGSRYVYLLQGGYTIRIYDAKTVKGELSVRALGTAGWIKVNKSKDKIEQR